MWQALSVVTIWLQTGYESTTEPSFYDLLNLLTTSVLEETHWPLSSPLYTALLSTSGPGYSLLPTKNPAGLPSREMNI
jgi:hypothetical protein